MPGVGLRERFFRQRILEAGDAVAGHILAGEHRCSARHANRGRDSTLREAHTVVCQSVDIGRVNDAVPGDAERIPAEVVGDQHDDVHRFCRVSGPEKK